MSFKTRIFTFVFQFSIILLCCSFFFKWERLFLFFRSWHRIGGFNVTFEQTQEINIVFSLLTLNKLIFCGKSLPINIFHVKYLLLYPLEKSENRKIPDVSCGVQKRNNGVKFKPSLYWVKLSYSLNCAWQNSYTQQKPA